MMDIKNLTNGVGQGALSVQKNEKITKTVPVLKSNSTYFIKKKIYDEYYNFYKWGILFFDILLYYFINVKIKIFYISSFNVVCVVYFTHS